MASSSEFDAIETELGEDLEFPIHPQEDSELLHSKAFRHLRQSYPTGWITVFGRVAVIAPTHSLLEKLVSEYNIPTTTKLVQINSRK